MRGGGVLPRTPYIDLDTGRSVMPATLNDIAARAGVSASTVSRVLNGQAAAYRISSETERSVRQAAKDLSYRANHLARGLRLSKTHTLGVVAPDISNPFFAHIIKRVQSAAHGHGYSIVVCNTDESLDLEVEQVRLLDRKRVDGLIAMPVGQRYDHFEEWIAKKVPLVLVDRCSDDVDAPSVSVDNYLGAYEATEHLVASGHRRIALIQGLPSTYTNTARLRGYRDALAAHGVPVDDGLIVGGDFRQQNGYVETKLLLQLDSPPTALFATSDLITLGALEALAEEGVSVPDDISLLSFDDFDFAPHLKSPLTVVWQPREMMGEMAVKLLVEQLGGGAPDARRIVLKPRLIVRDSVASRPVDVEHERAGMSV
jgi:LacI family transcriptional regulator